MAMQATSVQFAAVARSLATVARARGLIVPGFRSPPRVAGAERTLQWSARGAVPTVAVQLKGRPFGAVVADMVSVVGTTGTGFLQSDPVWRALEQLPAGELPSPYYLRLEVEDRAGVLARIAHELAAANVSVARLVQQPGDGHAVLHVVTHETPAGQVTAALAAIRALPESRGEARALPVVSDRGVEELGWA